MERIIHGDCLEELQKLPDNCVDSVVTDPPFFCPATHYQKIGRASCRERV